MYKRFLIALVIVVVVLVVLRTDNVLIYKLSNPYLEGIVSEIASDHIMITAKGGTNWRLRFDQETKFYNGENWRRMTVEELETGDCVEAYEKRGRPIPPEEGDFYARTIMSVQRK